MASTYAQLQKQIAALSQEAEKVKSAEASGAIAKIKELVAAYGLQAGDIFPTASSKASKAKGNISPSKTYADANGNTWGGKGKHPQWLRKALAAGRSLEEFVAGKAARKARARVPVSSTRAPAAKRKGAGQAKYRDGTNQWSGFGPQPKWLKEAVAAGRSADDFRL